MRAESAIVGMRSAVSVVRLPGRDMARGGGGGVVDDMASTW